MNIYQARTQLSKLVDQASKGQDVIISRNGKPVARLTALGRTSQRIQFGLLKGKVRTSADFDAPLSAAVLAEFEGSIDLSQPIGHSNLTAPS